MKKFWKYIIIALLGVLGLPKAQGFTGSGLENTKLTQCTRDGLRCLKMTSAKSAVSKNGRMIFLEKPSVQFVDTQNHIHTSLNEKSGYLDLSHGKLVLIQHLDSGAAIEVAYDLQSLREARTFIR
jgi:hypothetical protein